VTPLRLALLADGSSDHALLRVIEWTLRAQHSNLPISEPGFEVRHGDLGEAVRDVIRVHRPHLVFVHRDAETEALAVRRGEIPEIQHPLVRVVPVRMTEAWLLIDEGAIRLAAGNPNGKMAIALPPPATLESIPNPKALLHSALVQASSTSGRRQKRFRRDLGLAVQRVAEYVDDFSVLRALEAFRAFETDCREVLCSVLEQLDS